MAEHSYFVIMIDYGRKGREANVDPEITRREVVSRVKSGEYDRDRISFIHHVRTGEIPQDITADILAEVEALNYAHALNSSLDFIARQAFAFDHGRDSRKHEAV